MIFPFLRRKVRFFSGFFFKINPRVYIYLYIYIYTLCYLIFFLFCWFMFIVNYASILFLFALTFLIAFAVFLLSFVLSFQTLEDEKNSIYECGFVPFGSARNKFEVKFYLVSILFIVFDLEIAFLLPCVVSLSRFNTFSLITVFSFLLLVALGFAYEWKTGSMSW